MLDIALDFVLAARELDVANAHHQTNQCMVRTAAVKIAASLVLVGLLLPVHLLEEFVRETHFQAVGLAVR